MPIADVNGYDFDTHWPPVNRSGYEQSPILSMTTQSLSGYEVTDISSSIVPFVPNVIFVVFCFSCSVRAIMLVRRMTRRRDAVKNCDVTGHAIRLREANRKQTFENRS
jgi:hypothetical protein